MRAMGIILAISMLLFAGLTSVLGAHKAFDVSRKIARVVALAHTAGSEAADGHKLPRAELDAALPSPKRLHMGGFLALLAALAGGLAIVLILVWPPRSPHAALACAAFAALTIVVYPYIETGPLDGFAPRTHGIIAVITAGLGGLGTLVITGDKGDWASG